MSAACVILAAGLGTRMKSGVPKVLHRICGVTMLDSVVGAAGKVNPERVVVVAGAYIDEIKKSLEAEEVVFAHQKEAKGTGHALMCARAALRDFRGTVVVLNGDTPLIGHATIKRFLRLHLKGKNAVSVLSFRAKHPEGYGRIVRDAAGRVSAIVEEKDADPAQKRICEVNSGVYAFEYGALALLDSLRMNRAKGEYYLTDVVAEAAKRGIGPSAYCIGAEEEFMGVNTREELALAALLMRESIVKKWAGRGINFIDPGSVFIHAGVSIGRDATIYPNVHLEGRTRIGSGATIFPNVRILDSEIGPGAVIKDSTVIEDSKVMDRAAVGPFAHLRPGSVVGAEARVGNFVELKKAVIGKASKASHLSYLGDTVIGRRVNVGAGTITCNYDGVNKHKTVLGDGVFVGSDTQFVAPVKIGRGAYIGAGSTITEDVPPGALALSRSRQKNIRGWAKKRASGVKARQLEKRPEKKKGR
jgi:bifunctional UDP-N-acetylglucosamine pyrophosphorylase/glucosamine-1-phosphate N-acetyltransferase